MTGLDVVKSGTEKRALPPGWRWVRLGEVIKDAQAGFAVGERDPKGVIQLRMNNVDTRGRLDWSEFIRVPATQEEISKYRLLPGDVVFNNTNSTDLVGKSAHLLGHDELVVYSNHFTRLRTVVERLDSGYLAAWLLHQWQARLFARLCNRWIGQSAFKADQLLALEIPLPPLPEQKHIAAILNEQMAAVERARAAAEARLKAAKALPSAYLRATFDSPEAKAWPKKRLGELSLIGPDNGVFKHRSDFGHGVPIVNVSDLFPSLMVNLDRMERVQVSEDEVRRYGIAPGDLFFCRSSLKREGVGWCAYVGEVSSPAVFECHVMRIRLKQALACPAFVAHYWMHPAVRREVIGISRTATMTTMNQDDLARVTIPLAPLGEQKRIAVILNEQMATAGRIRKGIEHELEGINSLPATLLRRAFEGGL